ncbi:MAG: hypothetical protein M3Q44_04165 [bacterium]|nr:hypothetical protein [bacterium]
MKSTELRTFLFVAGATGFLLLFGFSFIAALDKGKVALNTFDTISAAACDTSFFTANFTKGCITANQRIYGDDARYFFFNPSTGYANLPYVQTDNTRIKDLTTFDWGLDLNKPATVYIFTRHIPGMVFHHGFHRAIPEKLMMIFLILINISYERMIKDLLAFMIFGRRIILLEQMSSFMRRVMPRTPRIQCI